MTPDSRLAWTLGLTLLLWAPAAVGMITNDLDITKSGLIFLGALLFSWVGTGIVSHLVESYRQSNYQVESAKRQIEALERRHEDQREQRRRKSDSDQEEEP